MKFEKEKEKKTLKDILGDVEIVPLRDFRITHNQFDIIIKEGVSVPVPRIFLQNLVTEGVINKLPE